jgi:polysaccharide export outer membrane protein
MAVAFRLFLVALVALVGASLSACAAGPAAGPLSEAELLSDRVVPEYRLGPADKVRVTVFGEEALTGEFTVGASGALAFPLVGEIRAQGLTTLELQEAIATALRQGYILEPRVSAEVLTYRPFYILGEVERPGEYPYTNGLTVLNAVATAEGFTYRADTRRVFIRRAGETGETAYRLTSTTLVAPGDTVRIGERFF